MIMELDYKNVCGGPYAISEITRSKEQNMSVRSDLGCQWYLHVLADLVNTKVIDETEFANFFQAHIEEIE